MPFTSSKYTKHLYNVTLMDVTTAKTSPKLCFTVMNYTKANVFVPFIVVNWNFPSLFSVKHKLTISK